MRKLIKEFVKVLMKEINKYYQCYYEEAPKTATFPFLVVPTIVFNYNENGSQVIIDIEINNNELSKVSVEDICDNLLINLDKKSIISDKIACILNVENTVMIKSSEQDLQVRKIVFIAQVYKLK